MDLASGVYKLHMIVIGIISLATIELNFALSEISPPLCFAYQNWKSIPPISLYKIV
jgi:hypothetical protein